MDGVTHSELLYALVGMIGTFIGGTWVLANKIGKIDTKIEVQTATKAIEVKDLRGDVDDHSKRLEKHDERITTLEQGKVMVAVLDALRRIDGNGNGI